MVSGRSATWGVVALVVTGLLVAPAGAAPSGPVAPAAAAALPPPELVSRTPAGEVPDAAASVGPMSADGRIVTYTSRATDIVPVLTGSSYQRAYVVDRSTGVTHLLATRRDGTPRSGASRPVAVSTGGRYVYYAYSYWFVAPDPNEARNGDTLRYDTRTGAVVTVSDLALTPSGNGRYGVLVTATPLVAADTNVGFDAYRVDLTPGQADQPVELLSRRPDGTAAGQTVPIGLGVSVSDDGRRVVFADDGDLDPAVSHDPADAQIYLWDAATGAPRLLSTSSAGVAGDRTSDSPVISGDGAVVAYQTSATNLGSAGGWVVTRDLDRATTRGIAAPDGWVPDSERDPSLARHGRYLSVRGALGQGSLDQQVARYDRATGTSRIVAEAPDGGGVVGTTLSRDASTILFGAYAPGGTEAVYAVPAGP